MTQRPSIGVECALVATLAAGLYAATLAPGVGAGDGGELLLAASTLGVPHPPGYPLWTLAAGVAAALPVGSLALRVNALSALFAAIAVALLFAFARRAGLGRFGAAVAAALYAVSIPVWRSAVEAEVYSLAAVGFLVLAHLGWSARSRRGMGGRAGAAFCFAAGLAYLAHQTLAAPGLVFAGAILARQFSWRRLTSGVAWFAAGLTPALVVPIRAAADGAYAWKARAPMEALADVFSRGAYGAVAQNPPRLDLAAGGVSGMTSTLVSGLGWIGALLVAVFLVAALRGRGGRSATLLRVPALAALSIPAGLLAWVRFTPDAEHLAQVEPFLIPVVAVLALGAGAGAAGLVRAARSAGRRRVARPRLGGAVAAAVAAAVAVTAGFHAVSCDRSGFRLPERYGRDLLATVPRGAVLVLDGDNETFLSAYLVRHERLRPDLLLRHRRGCSFGDAYGLAGLPRGAWAERAHAVDLATLSRGDRPVWFATPPADLERAGVRMEPRGLASRACASGEPARDAWSPPAAWPRSSDLLGGHPERYDFVTRKLAATYSDAAGRAAWARGDAGAALGWFEDAARVGFDMPEALWNVSVAAAAAGEPGRALDALLAARELAPHRAESAARLAAFLAAAGRYEDAARWFERAFRTEPSTALAADASRAWTLAGDRERAARWRDRAHGGRSVS